MSSQTAASPISSPPTGKPGSSHAFDVMQQFVVAPDRRYRVEVREQIFHFLITGSQFDADWVARGATRLGPKITEKLKNADSKKLLLLGPVIAVFCAVLFVFLFMGVMESPVPKTFRRLQGLAIPVFGLVLGLVMTIAGLCSRNTKGDRHNYQLALSDIVEAKNLPVQSELARRGEPQAARVQLRLKSGKSVHLSFPTNEDFAVLQEYMFVR